MKRFLLFFLSYTLLAAVSITAQQNSWQPQIAPGLPNSSQPQVIFSPVDDDVCWGINKTNSQFLRTTNGGTNWTVSTVTGAAGLRCSGISAIDANTAFIAMNDPSNTTSGGIFKTTDGGLNWVKQTTAFQGSAGHPNVIHFFDADNGLCVGNPRDGYWEIYTTTNGGSNWIRVSSGNIPAPLTGEMGIETSPVHGAVNFFWFPTLRNSLYRTTDLGYTWTVAYNVCGAIGFGFAFKDSLNGLAADFYPQSKLSRTTDGGVTWHPIDPLPPGLSSISPLFIVYAKGTIGSYVITSQTNLGGNPMVPGTVYSNDNGETWTQVSNFLLGPAAFSDWNTGWAGGINDTIWKWNSDILPVELTSFVALVQDSKVILNWVTASEINNLGFEIQRKFETRDFATVGFISGEGTITDQKEYSYTDKNLTDGKYFYRLKQVDFNGAFEYSNIIEVDVRSLDNFSLEQNYPNPFNPSTTIGYVLQEKGNVRLTLMNAIGEEVVILVNEEQDKGYHKVELHGKSLSSGVYYYQLNTNGFIQTKKLILMK